MHEQASFKNSEVESSLSEVWEEKKKAIDRHVPGEIVKFCSNLRMWWDL